jgi:hypothetical protein
MISFAKVKPGLFVSTGTFTSWRIQRVGRTWTCPDWEDAASFPTAKAAMNALTEELG